MPRVDYFAVIHKYISPESELYRVYLPHVVLVTNKALSIARHLNLSADQLRFIEEASMLHDIGICKVKSTKWKSESDLPYITHCAQGAEILKAEGLPAHAQVAARHTGVGITVKQIVDQDLPLPHQDHSPQTLEEKIISYADLFFSKRLETMWQEETPEMIIEELSQFGQSQVEIFKSWHEQFAV